ncbi:MAG: phage virion morphogenesis protein [Sideroxydans sp.]|nr:phage virion morphogenesis protein [Sideroxydans sp.]
MFKTEINDRQVMRLLDHLQQSGRDMSPVMRAISTELASQTEDNFADEGRPKWQPLSESTIEARKKRGALPIMIMQDSGQLAASYSTGSDAVSAWIGSNKKQAAIQNLGGKAGRGHKSIIPARPQVPITTAGNLQPQAVDAVVRLLVGHFGAQP